MPSFLLSLLGSKYFWGALLVAAVLGKAWLWHHGVVVDAVKAEGVKWEQKLTDERVAAKLELDRAKGNIATLEAALAEQNAAVAKLKAESEDLAKKLAAAKTENAKSQAKTNALIAEIRSHVPADPKKMCDSAMLELRQEIGP